MRYVEGLIGTSERKNMRQMWESLEDPGDYQALHHFLTESTWSDAKVWEVLREAVPDRSGVLIADDTGIPKHGKGSVGVQRQYSGTLGKIGNCQIAVSATLHTRESNWLLAMDLYLPEVWMNDPERRERVEIPTTLAFRHKWEISLDQIRTIREAGFEIECVLADAGYGNSVEYRAGLARMGLFYIVGVQGKTTIFVDPPRIVEAKRNPKGRDRRRRIARNNRKPVALGDLSTSLPSGAWKKIQGLRAKFAAVRVVPAHEWVHGKIQEECWLLMERRPNETKWYFSNLPPGTSLSRLVEVCHGRWAIEQNYRNLKNELGLDHFAGRRFEGWNHHAALTAVAYTFLEQERRRGTSRRERLTFPVVRKFIRKVFLCLHVAGDRDLYRTVVSFHRNPPRRI